MKLPEPQAPGRYACPKHPKQGIVMYARSRSLHCHCGAPMVQTRALTATEKRDGLEDDKRAKREEAALDRRLARIGVS